MLLNLGKEVKAFTSFGEFADGLHLAVRSRPIAPTSAGVDFVGYITRPACLLPRRRVVEALCKELTAAEKLLAPVSVQEPYVWCCHGLVLSRALSAPGAWTPGTPRRFAQAGPSRRDGHLVHASSHRLRQHLWNAYPIALAVLRSAEDVSRGGLP